MMLLGSGCTLFSSVQQSNLGVVQSPSSYAGNALNLGELQSFKDYQASRQIAHSRHVEKLPAPALVVNAEVKKELNSFLKGNGRYLKGCLDRRGKYYPVMAQIFEDEGVPHELISLALIESGYDVQARSNVGAVGMWQFMKGTARLYGLSVSLFEDQRKDPILSTVAAARHLKDLYRVYKDWYLALAAYNAGPGAVQRVVGKSGTNDFWGLSRRGKFAKETRDFIPRFIAAALIAGNPESFGIVNDQGGEMMASLGVLPEESDSHESEEVVGAQNDKDQDESKKDPAVVAPAKRIAGWPGDRHTPLS